MTEPDIVVPSDRGPSVKTAFGELCESFCTAAVQTWDDLRDSIYNNAIIGEESITDYLLLRLRRSAPNLVYRKYKKREEHHESGADWLWWFTSGNRGFPLLIQAKRIYQSGRYDHLRYDRRKRGSQINILLRYARKKNYCPLYCFYNFWDHEPVWAQGKFGGDLRLWGCAVACAASIKQHLKMNGSDNNLDAIGPLSAPWIVLVCSAVNVVQPSSRSQFPDRVRTAVLDVLRVQRAPLVWEELPQDVLNLRDGVRREIDSMAWDGPPASNLAGIVVVDQPMERTTRQGGDW